MAYRQTKQRMRLEIERKKGKVNVKEWAIQRGESAYTTWSIEWEGVRRKGLPYGEDENCVVDFRTQNLCLFVEAYAVQAADTFCKETCNMRYFMFFFGG